jgi:hypothetical protein
MGNNRMNLISIFVTLLYVGSATVQLFSVITGKDESIPFMNEFLMPGYLFGFALGFAGGTVLAIFGQIITFFVVWGISYSWFKALHGCYRKLMKQ